MNISVVTTLYNSRSYIDEFYRRISLQATKIGGGHEIIFVDDGSPDDSLQIALSLAELDHRVKVIELSRNHGHHRAMMVGLEHAAGDHVFLIDVDLEENPDELGRFWETLKANESADVVYGVQKVKNTPPLRKLLSKLFYRVFNLLSIVKIPSNSLVSRLMTRDYVQALVSHQEHEIFLPALWELTGFRQVALETEKQFDGVSNYTLVKRLKMSIMALSSFSSTPLVAIFYLGLIVSMVSALVVAWLVFRHFFLGLAVPGWASIVTSVYLVGGLTIFSIGVIGGYLSKVFIEVKKRPRVIIRKIHGDNDVP